MNPTPLMCVVLQTQQKHLGSFLSLIFCLKPTRELIVLTFLGSCCHNVIVVLQVRNIQSLATDYQDLSGFFMSYGIFLNRNTLLILRMD